MFDEKLVISQPVSAWEKTGVAKVNKVVTVVRNQ